MNVSPGLSPASEAPADAQTQTASAAAASDTVASRLDFAEVAAGRLLVYGWIVNFSTAVRAATIHLGSFSIDLVRQATPIRRPDVAKHFALGPGSEDHGFYALVDLPAEVRGVDRLDLRIRLASGQVAETHWPVVSHATPEDFLHEPYLTPLTQLVGKLPKLEARRLINLIGPSMKLRTAPENASVLPPPLEFVVELCCVLDRRTLVVAGWRLDPFQEVTTVALQVGASVWPLWEHSISYERRDLKNAPSANAPSANKRRNAAELPGFMFVHEVPPGDADSEEAVLLFAVGEDIVQLTQALSSLPNEASRDFISFFGKLDPESALTLSKHLASTLGDASSQGRAASLLELVAGNALEGLASSIDNDSPRYMLYIDQVIPVGDSGIFIGGWFNSGPGLELEIVCHRGQSTFSVSEHWFRHPRADVSSHLANLGIQASDHAHGFTCYVPASYAPATGPDALCYLSATTPSGKSRHVRFAVADPPERPGQTIRSLLTSFHAGHPQLRSLLDRQIGPAVTAAWSGASKPPRTPMVRAFGDAPANPAVSIIVPLYGRHDFAAYQMALFANDPDFQGANSATELIYVVDDPSILADFLRGCDDLSGIYEVPFLVASSGLNLGFAGANNFASEVARGRYLLFLNSDVMPKRAGWVGDLARAYESLPSPGVLGAKLLYEDGSVQHAGMAFRRNPAWDNLWINDHPLKGQSPLGLTGVRQVPAVTAACALMEASIFRELGGFCEDYIIGDFEDSDLCLRLDAIGRASYVALDVELYHLERQSQNRLNDVNWRTNLTLYNCWLHNSRWGRLIASRAEDFASSALPAPDGRQSSPAAAT